MRKTQEEIDAMLPAELKVYKRQQQDIVFGVDAPRGKGGKPIEQGIGSALHPTENHVAALRNSFGINPNEAQRAIISKAEKELADYQAKQAARQDDEEAA